MKKILLILIIIFSIQSLFSQTMIIPRASALADIDTLFYKINDVHVNMYANIQKRDLDKKIQKVKNKITKDISTRSFFLLLAPLVADIGDGHTQLYFPTEDFINGKAKIFPYKIKINENDSVMTVDYSFLPKIDTIPKNAIITEINGINTKKIIGKMMNFCSGERYFYKLSKVNMFFPFLQNIMFNDTIFKIKYLDQNAKREVVNYPVSYLKAKNSSNTKNDFKKQKPFSFKLLKESSIGIIDFRHFTQYNKFKTFLDSIFTIMKRENVKNLIIDIRNNSGGNSRLGDELFQYISHVPFQQFEKNIIKTSKTLKKALLTDLKHNKSQVYLKQLKNANLGIESYEYDKLDSLRKNKLRYHGNVYLLISHNTFSSAASFSWAFKYFKMGKIIGEESGGMGVCFGDAINLKLPYSHLIYTVSYKKIYQYHANDNDVHGTIPDYKIDADKALDYTLKLIKQSQ